MQTHRRTPHPAHKHLCKLHWLPDGRVKYGPITCTDKRHANRKRYEAWDKCVEVGLLIGVHEGGWRKAHNSLGWHWVSRFPLDPKKK